MIPRKIVKEQQRPKGNRNEEHEKWSSVGNLTFVGWGGRLGIEQGGEDYDNGGRK